MAKFTSLFCIAVMALVAVSSAQPMFEDNAALAGSDITFDKRATVVDNNEDPERITAAKRSFVVDNTGDQENPTSIKRDATDLNSIKRDAIKRDAIKRGAIKRGAIKRGAIKRDAIKRAA
ncbi:hypothetical protein LRAMOSA02321 [Lichtheimia ramosa]|uniref:Uncharacterized protein n=1 Tax=Lichtheimia ramosa TaxID=688394 RepID=A0A077WMI6_9FUNG|nr:hypothetical protein LRAMOSA02321 [Lichtheimia ramosa]